MPLIVYRKIAQVLGADSCTAQPQFGAKSTRLEIASLRGFLTNFLNILSFYVHLFGITITPSDRYIPGFVACCGQVHFCGRMYLCHQILGHGICVV
jgi:hypothetical protein